MQAHFFHGNDFKLEARLRLARKNRIAKQSTRFFRWLAGFFRFHFRGTGRVSSIPEQIPRNRLWNSQSARSHFKTPESLSVSELSNLKPTGALCWPPRVGERDPSCRGQINDVNNNTRFTGLARLESSNPHNVGNGADNKISIREYNLLGDAVGFRRRRRKKNAIYFTRPAVIRAGGIIFPEVSRDHSSVFRAGRTR